MNHKHFIQTASIAFMAVEMQKSQLPSVDKALKYSELLWQRLGEKGYGMDAKTPQDLEVNWYSRLKGEALKQFDLFWNAFAYKKGRGGAAMRWYQMTETEPLQEAELEKILVAARKAATERDPRNGTPMMAQGWLTNRRYDDYELSGAAQKAVERVKADAGRLPHLKSLYALSPNDALKKQIEELEGKLKA